MKSIRIMPFIQTSLAQSESASPEVTTLYVYNMSLFIVACLLNRWQRASRDKVPTKQGQRLDHATKLEASLARKFRCHVCVVKVCGLFMTLCVTCNLDADANVCKSKP